MIAILMNAITFGLDPCPVFVGGLMDATVPGIGDAYAYLPNLPWTISKHMSMAEAHSFCLLSHHSNLGGRIRLPL